MLRVKTAPLNSCATVWLSTIPAAETSSRKTTLPSLLTFSAASVGAEVVVGGLHRLAQRDAVVARVGEQVGDAAGDAVDVVGQVGDGDRAGQPTILEHLQAQPGPPGRLAEGAGRVNALRS